METDKIINDLCIKFGTTVDYLVPEMAKYYIAKNIFGLIATLVLIIVSAKSLVYFHKKRILKDDIYFDIEPEDIICVINALTIFVSFICFLVYFSSLIGWAVSPIASFSRFILSYL